MNRNLFLLLSVLCLGCSEKSDTGIVGSPDDPVTMVESDDPEMAAAEAKARETLDDFIAALQNPKPNQSDFGVKYAFSEGDTFEHMWITELTYANGEFSGVLGNDPALVKNIKNGDSVTIKRADVEDWLYFEGEDLIGGYTAKLLMSRE